MTKKIALCQCLGCERYLAENRDDTSAADIDNYCTECAGPHGLRLAKIRETVLDPRSTEVLSVLSEECAEVIQRKEKIMRWGWEADFEGTTQVHKLELELGDVVAATILTHHNGKVNLVNVVRAAEAKLQKFREDARGPRQRLLVVDVPMTRVDTLLRLACLASERD